MKYLLVLLMTISANADTPGTVKTSESDQQCKIVTLTVCKGEKAVVVKKAKKKKLIYLNDIPIPKDRIVEKQVTVDKTRRNAIFLYGQRKIADLDAKSTGSTAKVESVRETVVGVGYQRQFDSGLMLGAGVDTLGDVQAQVGVSW